MYSKEMEETRLKLVSLDPSNKEVIPLVENMMRKGEYRH